MNQYINIYLHWKCRKTSFIYFFIVTAKNLILLVVFLFFCSWWLAEEYLFVTLGKFLVFKRLLNKNFNQMVFIVSKVIYSLFCSKNASLFCELSTNNCNSSFLKFLIFFLHNFISLKYIKVLRGRLVSFCEQKDLLFD